MSSLNCCEQLSGVLSNDCEQLSGVLSNDCEQLSGVLSLPTYSETNIYDGTYEVTSLPRTDYILPTAESLLTQDITVKAIPYFENDNAFGGLTVYIGEAEV